MNTFPLLSFLTLIPLLGGGAVLLAPGQTQRARRVALAFSLLALGVAALLWAAFDTSKAGYQFAERVAWVAPMGIDYRLGIDGLGLLMVVLSALIVPFAMLASWKIEQNARLYFALILFLEAGLIGTFTALNFFHWFIYWELGLIPAYFLIKMWGGPRRTRAANQFFIYTLAGSVAMLLAFLAIYAATGLFDFDQLAALARNGGLDNALFDKLHGSFFTSKETLATVIFLGVFLGFAVKAPLMPFHTWLPSAYAEAPTGTSMLLTGAMSKMGVYGFLRILLPLFPAQMRAMQTPLLCLAVVTIVFSAAAALAQRDLKRMVAYSSINHVGYCLLGIFAVVQLTGDPADSATDKAAALNGVMLQMFNHGLTASALFYCVGLIEQRSGGLRGLDDFGGLRKAAPVFCGLMGIALFASLGLPGLNGFVSEFLIFKGVLPLAGWAAAVSTLGLLITAIFLLAVLQRVFSGPLRERWAGWKDLTTGERLTLAPMIALIFVLGICPQILISVANPAALAMLKLF
ncbi:MAG TPA: NADH-quinone oxidoreductase subunit M [Candidatus Acidoferrum sp.]|nr:NADH-quinone oxidoreductase subunit M [Candidatus Acidoferrum sp.]